MSIGFTETAMSKKLEQLNQAMQSIQTLSLWLVHHRKHSARIVEIWNKELRKEKRPQKLLSFVYLANDVIQNSRKKWPLFLEQFLGVLDKALAHVAKYADEKTVKAVKRVIQVWKERNVYSGKSIEKITYAVTSNLTSKQLALFNEDMAKTPPRKEPSSPVVQTPPLLKEKSESVVLKPKDAPDSKAKNPAPTTSELLAALKQLEEPASADAATREKIASFPEAVANPIFLKQIANQDQADELYKIIKNAEPVVTEYCTRLSKEMGHRRSTQELLVNYLAAQKEKAESTQELLNQFQQKREKLSQERQEVYKHYESLPDLSKLSSVQLPPLPSAGELFNK